MTSSWPRPAVGSTVFMTPAALGYYQETFRQLALSYAVCWFPCCNARGTRQAGHWFRIRRKTLVQNGSAAVSWSEVPTAAAVDSAY